MKELVLLVLLVAQTALAQIEYQANILSPALTENAHAIVRRHETTFTVKSVGEAIQRIRTVVTVLDEQGDEHMKKKVWYDKFSKVTNLEGALYDASGKQIRKLKKADIEDYSTFSDYNFFDDNRYKAATFPKQPTYPYTVEFIEETTERNLMFYPSWMPQNDEHLSVEQAVFVVSMPPGLALRYKEMNLPASGTEQTGTNGEKTYTWKLTNCPAIEFEPMSPPVREVLPVVYTAPTDFDVQDHKGSIRNWSDVGRFYYRLNNGRDRIPDELRQQVVDLTKSESTTAGKVQKLYQFLQGHTRYVSVQLGIGGWQTIEAEKVASSKYGDCKALTNYMKALLKAAGVTAYPALVRAGSKEPDTFTDFPSFQFNHVILCVPDKQDTLFLECTSSRDPAGYVSSFTGSRHVLLILPEGGLLIKTPTYRPSDNRQQRRIVVKVTEQGDAVADVQTRYTGLQGDKYTKALHSLNRNELRSWMLKEIHIPAFELNRYTHSEQSERIPAVTETMEIAVRRWATTSGTRLFLPLNLMSVSPLATPLTQPRRAAVELGPTYDFEDSDTITYQLPKGYSPEYQIAPVTVESKFGRYTAQVVINDERVVYIRKMAMHRGRFPAAAYGDWVDFQKKIAKADRAQLVFVKNG